MEVKENVDEELVTSLSSESGVSENLVRLCVERGDQTVEDHKSFFRQPTSYP